MGDTIVGLELRENCAMFQLTFSKLRATLCSQVCCSAVLLPYDAFMAVIFVHEHGFARGLKPSHQNALDQRQQAVQHLLIFKVSQIACQENGTMLPLDVGDPRMQ